MSPTIRPDALSLALFLGGPSAERNISLDSARTFFDACRSIVPEEQIELIFVDPECRFFRLRHAWIYSNTLEDFAHLLSERENPAGELLDETTVMALIKQVDCLCPMIHGRFGEDGELSRRFEAAGRKAFLGSPSKGLALTLDKAATLARLGEIGLPRAAHRRIERASWEANRDRLQVELIESFQLADPTKPIIVKPNDCGSSDGVSKTNGAGIPAALDYAFEFSDDALVERFIEGREFSLIVLQDQQDRAVPLFPTEIRIRPGRDSLYTRRKKYMPGAGAEHITPLSADPTQLTIDATLLERMRSEAITIFEAFELRDWARFDGFLTPDGEILWSDLNGISGFGQDSFVFQQGALFELSAQGIAWLLLARALARENKRLLLPESNETRNGTTPIAILGGGSTAERHVSRMSWLNVISKLSGLRRYHIENIFLDRMEQFWRVPRFVTLQHTVEEIEQLVAEPDYYLQAAALTRPIIEHHFQTIVSAFPCPNFRPESTTLEQIATEQSFAFLALHGGVGENGELQRRLDRLSLPYNGSSAEVARLCMNKNATNQRCRELAIPGFAAPPQEVITLDQLRAELTRHGWDEERLNRLADQLLERETLTSDDQFSELATLLEPKIKTWHEQLASPFGVVIKPLDDGCSTGVLVARQSQRQLSLYLLFVLTAQSHLPATLLYGDAGERREDLEMPSGGAQRLLLERYLGSDRPDEFVEMTVGVFGRRGAMRAMLPSATPSLGDVLSLDEKFHKGMGVNLTPPPMLSGDQVMGVRTRVAQFANAIGLANYARIDVMYHLPDDTLYLIEVNTLPGLTSATIIFTQALVTPELQLKPAEFLDHLIQEALAAHNDD